jgi:hypothetical protein
LAVELKGRNHKQDPKGSAQLSGTNKGQFINIA